MTYIRIGLAVWLTKNFAHQVFYSYGNFLTLGFEREIVAYGSCLTLLQWREITGNYLAYLIK